MYRSVEPSIAAGSGSAGRWAMLVLGVEGVGHPCIVGLYTEDGGMIVTTPFDGKGKLEAWDAPRSGVV